MFFVIFILFRRDLVATWRVSGKLMEGMELPLCFQAVMNRFESYQPIGGNESYNTLIFAFVLPFTTTLCHVGEKAVMESAFMVIQK